MAGSLGSVNGKRRQTPTMKILVAAVMLFYKVKTYTMSKKHDLDTHCTFGGHLIRPAVLDHVF